MPLAPGDVVAGYRVIRQLGTGGMGAVYLVAHPRLPRSDALKLLHRDLSADPDFSARFLREAEILAGLSHRNIVPVYDRGEYDGQLWLSMQYVEGMDAEDALAQAGGALPAERVVRIISGISAALDFAHRHHLVHRDVKPANILLTAPADADDEEQVFLTDFGIAKDLEGATKLTRTGMVVATFDYASPEQIEERPLDARSDVYSLGCVLYKLLTGRVPYPGTTVAAALHGHLGQPPPRPTDVVPWVPPGLDDVVLHAMAKKPEDRYPTCRAMAAAAETALRDLPEPPPLPYRVSLRRDTGAAPVVAGPVSTEGMSADEGERLLALVRRTRFFDLPASLEGTEPEAGGWGSRRRTMTIEVAATGRAHRLVAPVDGPRRPPDLDALAATIEAAATAVRSAAADRVPAPPTVVGKAGATPTATPPLPTPRATNSSSTPTLPSSRPPWEHQAEERVQEARTPTPAVPQARAVAPPVSPDAGPPQFRSEFSPPVHYPPGPPPQVQGLPPGTGRPRRRTGILVAAVIAALVAAGSTYWLLDHEGRSPGGPSASSAARSTSPAEQALRSLPRGPALSEALLVVPRQVGNAVNLYLVDATSGATTKQLTKGAETDSGPLISPDRRSIVYERQGELRVQGSDGTGDRALFATPLDCPGIGRPAWNSRLQTQLAVRCTAAGKQVIRVVTLDGRTVRELDPGISRIDDLSWAGASGNKIVYWGTDDPQADGGKLLTLTTDGSHGPVVLTDSGPGVDADPIWSPDGTRIAFRRVIAPGQSRVYVMGADGSSPRPLTGSSGIQQDPSWSPDGTMIAYKSSQAGAVQPPGDHIWVMRSDGSGQRELDDGGTTATNAPAWGNR